MIHSLFNSIMEISLTSSCVILTICLISPLFEKRYAAKWLYYIWLLIALRLLIPVPLTVPDAPIQINPEKVFHESEMLQPSSLPDFTSAADMPTQMTADSADIVSLVNIGSALWIAGVLVFSVYHILNYIFFVKNIRRWILQADSEQKMIFSRVIDDLKIKSPVALYRCETVKIPMMFGIINPTVLIPCNEYSHTDQYLIYKHELMHCKTHDIHAKILMFVVQAIYWFNPCVHLMSRKFNHAIEMKCDDYVVNGCDSTHKKRYIETILLSIKQQSSCKSMFTSNYTGGMIAMKKRFLNIVHSGNKRKGAAALTLLMLACFGASSLVACTSSEVAAKEKTAVQDTASADSPKSSEKNKPQQTDAVASKDSKQAQDGESNSVPPGIVGVYAESKANPALEKVIIDELGIPDEYLDKTKYYYNYVDLNCDGKDEIFAVVMGPFTSGTGGSTALIVVQSTDGLHVNQVLTLIHTPVIISDKVSKGCREIVALKSGGGANGNYAILTCSDGYYSTVNEGTEISSLDGISGKAIISNDILKDMEEGKSLYLHP